MSAGELGGSVKRCFSAGLQDAIATDPGNPFSEAIVTLVLGVIAYLGVPAVA
jgi:hypothetical protein